MAPWRTLTTTTIAFAIWAAPAWAASHRMADADLLGDEIQVVEAGAVAAGSALFHQGLIYMAGDEIEVTLHNQREVRSAQADGRARLSLGTFYVVADRIVYDASAASVTREGHVTVHRDAERLHAKKAVADLAEMTLQVHQPRGRLVIPNLETGLE